ncbi:hypothetical protein QCA50_005492 [Cerrena zonata]|uniref:Uncharacterized protein n=1 Tax=Cerrena zonata TaxID=2478898 RepID=A0AAW0GRA0_9APHY
MLSYESRSIAKNSKFMTITKSKVAKTRRGTRTPKAHPTSKTYAREHGLDRGGTKKLDNSPTGQPPVLDPGAADEGLLAFVQSTTCRRKIWAEAFDVPAASLEVPSVPCCDICDPSLFDATRPGIQRKASKQSVPKKGESVPEIQSQLRQWRRDIFERDHALAQYEAKSLLNNELVATLSAHGPLSEGNVAILLSESWVWWQRYGTELTSFVVALKIPFVPNPKKLRKESVKEKPEAEPLPSSNARKRMPASKALQDDSLSPKRFRINERTDASSTGQQGTGQDRPVKFHTSSHAPSHSHTLSTSSFAVPFVQHTPYTPVHASQPLASMSASPNPSMSSMLHHSTFNTPPSFQYPSLFPYSFQFPHLTPTSHLPEPPHIVPSQAQQHTSMQPDTGSSGTTCSGPRSNLEHTQSRPK